MTLTEILVLCHCLLFHPLVRLSPAATATDSTGSEPGTSSSSFPDLVFPSTESSSSPISEASINQVMSRGQLEFAIDLYRSLLLVQNSDVDLSSGNVIFSPYSINTLLAMIYLGAAGNTSESLRAALHLSRLNYPDIHRGYKKIVSALKGGDVGGEASVNLTSAGAIFADENLPVSAKYTGILHDYYSASVRFVRFSSDESSARDEINAWVKRETGGRIERLLERPLSPRTRLVFLHALRLKAAWLRPFDVRLTVPSAPFRVTHTRRVHVAMMSGRVRTPFGRSETLACSVLELPLAQRNLSLFVLLPDEIDGLPTLEAHLGTDSLRHLLSTLRDSIVHVRLPRLLLQSTLDVKDALVHMGIGHLFHEDGADLSGLAPDVHRLAVDSVLHRAVFEVNEEGAEAAAASAIGVQRIGAVTEPSFEADHPFLFFLWDYNTSIILFMGRVVQPTATLVQNKN